MASSSPKTPDRDVATEAELNPNAARLQHLQPRTDRPFVTGRFELYIEIALVGRIGTELIGIIGHIDGSIGAESERLLQNCGHHIRRDDLSRTVKAGRDDRQSADRPASCHENPFAEQRPGALDRLQDDRES